ncbi:MAG: desulfoferrodoxin [Planctomycetes bacterium]|nr:desulfoferrodoxin [Planctomycetota bacterium]
MIKKLGIYACQPCGVVAEALTNSNEQLVCCDQPMAELTAKTSDEGKEKHVPIVERRQDSIKIKVGSNPHPMEEKHYIQWIDVIVDNKAYRQFLKPGQAPEVIFPITDKNIIVREYCNVHGLWKN